MPVLSAEKPETPAASRADDAAAVGGKAGRLQQLQAAGFPVPEFVVSPADVAAAVERLGTPVAVRSSASVEDGRDVSFAGQFESVLNLTAEGDIEAAIECCHASVRAPSVLNYRRRHRLDAKQIRMDVIVQRMIRPELAGVAFTVNPATGREEVVIEACEGVADSLLSGHQSPLPADHPLLNRHRSEIEAIARQIQRFFGAPQDIEFAIEDGRLYILQSRPITRISFAADVGEWTNADFRDGGVSSSVCTPLMWSLYDFVWDHSLKGCLRELRLFDEDFAAGRMFFGRPYWNLGAVKDCLARLPGFVERDFDNDLSVAVTYDGPGRCTPVTLGSVLRALPTLTSISRFFRRQRIAAERLLDSEFAELEQKYAAPLTSEDTPSSFAELIERDYLKVESTYFRTIFAASLAKLDLMSSFPDADYAALVAGLPPLRHLAPVRAVQALPERTHERLDEVIATYRHHCRLGLDIVHPRWDEDAAFVRRMLAELPASAGADPRPASDFARSDALSRLPRWRRRRFAAKLDRLRHFVWLREELRDLSSRMYYFIRRQVLQIAQQRRLGDDVFSCSFREILNEDRSNIARNRDVYESYRHFQPPNEIGQRYHLQPVASDDALQGIAASPGTVRGIAFVARTVEEASRMPAGRIVVCPFTDPGWTPVLDRVAGVVTETGGLLSHAAIICREYGIPAVLGVPQATSRIPHGSELVLHGSAGRVEIVRQIEPEGLDDEMSDRAVDAVVR
jgi:phosphohistidine swiveling domain-containing protein